MWDWSLAVSYRLAFIMQFVSIFFGVASFYFVSRIVGPASSPYLKEYGGSYFGFVLVGIALLGFQGVGMASFSSALSSAQSQGTLEAMLMTPTRVSTVILASAGWSYVFATLRVLVYMACGALLFGVRLGDGNYAGLLAALLLSIVSFSSLGILAASFTMLFKRGDPVTSLLTSGINLLGGVFFPVEVFAARAPWLVPVTQVLPLTYALHAMRLALLQRASLADLAPDLLILALFAVVLLPLSLVVFRWTVDRARVDGSLTHF